MGAASQGGQPMISLTRLDHSNFYINDDLIVFVEETPDTIVTIQSGTKLLVRESAKEIVDKVVAFRNRCVRFDTVEKEQ